MLLNPGCVLWIRNPIVYVVLATKLGRGREVSHVFNIWKF